MKPAAAWRLLATLRSALDGGVAPAAFRTEVGSTARRLGHRADAMVVERLSTGASLQLLRRAGESPRVLVQSAMTGKAQFLTFWGSALSTLPDVMTFVGFIKQLYDVLRPAAGIVDVVRNDGDSGNVHEHRATAVVAAGLVRAEPTPPAWLTVLGPERVEQIGAARLLMAPVFLIEMLPDGGLLVVDTPLPQEGGRGAGRRSTALSDHLQGEGVG